MVRKVSSGPSVAPLLIVALVAVVAVSGLFALGRGDVGAGVGVTGAQVASEDVFSEKSVDAGADWVPESDSVMPEENPSGLQWYDGPSWAPDPSERGGITDFFRYDDGRLDVYYADGSTFAMYPDGTSSFYNGQTGVSVRYDASGVAIVEDGGDGAGDGADDGEVGLGVGSELEIGGLMCSVIEHRELPVLPPCEYLESGEVKCPDVANPCNELRVPEDTEVYSYFFSGYNVGVFGYVISEGETVKGGFCEVIRCKKPCPFDASVIDLDGDGVVDASYQESCCPDKNSEESGEASALPAGVSCSKEEECSASSGIVLPDTGVSSTGQALSFGGKGSANWLIFGTALLAVVLLGVIVKSGPAKSKKAKKRRALILAGILVLAIVAGGLVLVKPVSRGNADANSVPQPKECQEALGDIAYFLRVLQQESSQEVSKDKLAKLVRWLGGLKVQIEDGATGPFVNNFEELYHYPPQVISSKSWQNNVNVLKDKMHACEAPCRKKVACESASNPDARLVGSIRISPARDGGYLVTLIGWDGGLIKTRSSLNPNAPPYMELRIEIPGQEPEYKTLSSLEGSLFFMSVLDVPSGAEISVVSHYGHDDCEEKLTGVTAIVP